MVLVVMIVPVTNILLLIIIIIIIDLKVMSQEAEARLHQQVSELQNDVMVLRMSLEQSQVPVCR